MICIHLHELEEAIQARGIRETYRGQAWSENYREWIYFDCYLEREEIRERFGLEACVKDHEHWGTHNGQEAGFYFRSIRTALRRSMDNPPRGRVFPPSRAGGSEGAGPPDPRAGNRFRSASQTSIMGVVHWIQTLLKNLLYQRKEAP